MKLVGVRTLSVSMLAVISLFAAGCVETKLMNRLSVGMTKAQVIDVLGEPDSTAAIGPQEYLRYGLVTDPWTGAMQPYYVGLIEGRVFKYGRAGDFDPRPRGPISPVTININR